MRDEIEMNDFYDESLFEDLDEFLLDYPKKSKRYQTSMEEIIEMK